MQSNLPQLVLNVLNVGKMVEDFCYLTGRPDPREHAGYDHIGYDCLFADVITSYRAKPARARPPLTAEQHVKLGKVFTDGAPLQLAHPPPSPILPARH
jgi:hypothetical protein